MTIPHLLALTPDEIHASAHKSFHLKAQTKEMSVSREHRVSILHLTPKKGHDKWPLTCLREINLMKQNEQYMLITPGSCPHSASRQEKYLLPSRWCLYNQYL